MEETSSSILLFGSLTSSEETAQIFREDNPLGLQVLYHNTDHDTAMLPRFVGEQRYTAPRRRLKLPSTFDSMGYAPAALSANGWIAEDYLVLTVIPNYWNTEAYYAGERIFIVGGLHGTATEAFPRILADSEIIKALLDRSSDRLFFQAVIPVTDIEHAHELQLSTGTKFELLEDDFYELNAGDLYGRIEQLPGLKI